jgi:hypothetical protein
MSTLELDFTAAREPLSEAARTVLDAAERAKAERGGTGIKGLMLGRSDTFDVSPFDIQVKPGFNGRDFSLPENQQHVLDLAASIAAKGVLQPLTVYYDAGTLWLSDGESRLRATLHAINVLGAPIMSVPVRTEARGTNDAARVAGQLIRNSGKPFTPLEKASVVNRLLGFGWSVEQVASETGMTASNVRRLLDRRRDGGRAAGQGARRRRSARAGGASRHTVGGERREEGGEGHARHAGGSGGKRVRRYAYPRREGVGGERDAIRAQRHLHARPCVRP